MTELEMKINEWIEKSKTFFENLDESCPCFMEDGICSKKCKKYSECHELGLIGNSLGFKMVD